MRDWQERNAQVEDALARASTAPGDTAARVECPFCVSSKTLRADASMNVDLALGLYYCHRCTTGGRLRGERFVLGDAVSGRRRDVLPDSEVLERRRKAAQPPAGYMPLWEEPYASAELTADARAYAAKRGFSTPALLEQFQVGAVLEGYYAGRIIIPLTLGGHWWGWVGRDFTGSPPVRRDGEAHKYEYPKGCPRGAYLWNYEALQVETDVPVLVVEGAIDAAPKHWPDAVPVLGKPSRLHRRMFAEAKRPVAFALDRDAFDEAEGYAMELTLEGVRAGAVLLPHRRDPDSLDAEWLRAAARRCLP